MEKPPHFSSISNITTTTTTTSIPPPFSDASVSDSDTFDFRKELRMWQRVWGRWLRGEGGGVVLKWGFCSKAYPLFIKGPIVLEGEIFFAGLVHVRCVKYLNFDQNHHHILLKYITCLVVLGRKIFILFIILWILKRLCLLYLL